MQIWRNENEHIHAQEALQQLQQVWEVRQLRLLNFILQVPCEPSAAPGRSKRQMLRRDVMAQDSGTFILSGETQPLWPSESPPLGAVFIHHIPRAPPDLASLAQVPILAGAPATSFCSETLSFMELPAPHSHATPGFFSKGPPLSE